jgi:hypothetical protein
MFGSELHVDFDGVNEPRSAQKMEEMMGRKNELLQDNFTAALFRTIASN